MKKATKLLSVLLAIVILCSSLAVAAFAEKTDADRVNGWKNNYSLVLDKVFDNTNFTSWNYVDQNKKAINQTMDAYTVFALYDGAWTNYASKTLNVDDAEKILLGLIEKADYTFDDGYVDEIVKVLETAGDVNDFIQKVNKVANIELFASSGWSKTFSVIGDVTKIANAYQNYRDEFIETYARILSVQKANKYYVDFLNYIVAKNSYGILTQAAKKLIADINTGVDEALSKVAASMAEDGANLGLKYLAEFALNSNAYTAVALKVYNIGTSVADFLWNTSDQYTLIDTVKTAYYFQADAAEWAKKAVYGEDADKAVIAMAVAINAREISENALYNLKLAENSGAINKIKNKLYGTIFNYIDVNKALLSNAKDILFNTDVDAMKPITRIISVYAPVDIALANGNGTLYTLNDGTAGNFKNAYGIIASVYSAYTQLHNKVVFLYDNYTVKLTAKTNEYITLVLDAINANGVISDWSFTDLKVSSGAVVSFNTAYTGTPVYTVAGVTKAFDDVFKPSAQPDVTFKEVITATAEVTKEEIKTTTQKVVTSIKSTVSKIKNLFKR